MMENETTAPETATDQAGRAMSDLLSGWVNVADELPHGERKGVNTGKMFTVVMVYHAGGHDIAMYYEGDGFRINGIKDGSEVAEELHDMKVETITHWMPLPKPPAG